MTCTLLVRLCLAAACLLGLAPAPAHAQGVSLKAHWTRDKLAYPPVSLCSTSGAVGGTLAIHVSFQSPPNMYGAKVKEIRVHEQAGHYDDLVFQNHSFSGQPHTACGETAAPGMLYFDGGLRSQDLHNGAHTITAIVEYIVMIPPPNQYQQPTMETRTSSTSITVDFQNLLINSTTPADPVPILWDPATMTSVSLSAQVSAAYRASHPVKLTIYSSNQSPIKTLQQTVAIGTGTTTVSFNWDGTTNGYPPGPAAKGVYLFKWEAGDNYQSGDQDTEKSTRLSVTDTRTELTGYYDELTNKNEIKDSMVLVDGGSPQVDATDANVRVYDADLAVIAGPVTMPVTTNSPGASPAVRSEVVFALEIQEVETHLFAARDGHAMRDKGHRNRWALQNNQKPQRPRADCFAVIFPGADLPAQQRLRKMGYVAYAKGSQTAGTIYDLIQKDTVMFYSGGGALDSTGVQDFYGGVAGSNRTTLLGNRTSTVPSQWPGFSFHFLADLPAAKLSGVKLAVWLACFTAKSSDVNNGSGDFRTGNVTHEAYNRGARTSLGFKNIIRAGGVYTTWTVAFFDRLKTGGTVQQAALAAAVAANAGGYTDYDEFFIYGFAADTLP